MKNGENQIKKLSFNTVVKIRKEEIKKSKQFDRLMIGLDYRCLGPKNQEVKEKIIY